MSYDFIYYKVTLENDKVTWNEMVSNPEGFGADVSDKALLILRSGEKLTECQVVKDKNRKINLDFITNMVIQRDKTLSYYIAVRSDLPDCQEIFMEELNQLMVPYSDTNKEPKVIRILN